MAKIKLDDINDYCPNCRDWFAVCIHTYKQVVEFLEEKAQREQIIDVMIDDIRNDGPITREFRKRFRLRHL
jgi:hypothetical protein